MVHSAAWLQGSGKHIQSIAVMGTIFRNCNKLYGRAMTGGESRALATGEDDEKDGTKKNGT